MYRAVSLFSGIGGIDLAFAQAGFDITAQVEIDPYCREVLKRHAWYTCTCTFPDNTDEPGVCAHRPALSTQ